MPPCGACATTHDVHFCERVGDLGPKLVDDAIERQERHAESELQMARLFIDRGKIEIGRRRLQEVVELYGKSDSAKEAKKLLKSI